MEGNEITRGTRKFFVSVGGICGGVLIRYFAKLHQMLVSIIFTQFLPKHEKIINYFRISAVQTC